MREENLPNFERWVWEFPGGQVAKTPFTAEGAVSIPGWGAKNLQPVQCGQKKKKKKKFFG